MRELPDVLDLRIRWIVAGLGAALALVGWYRFFGL
jgi:hypothetical protein